MKRQRDGIIKYRGGAMEDGNSETEKDRDEEVLRDIGREIEMATDAEMKRRKKTDVD